MAKENLKFPILMDAQGDADGLYRAPYFPTSYFIDTKGIIRDIEGGAVPDLKPDRRYCKLLKLNRCPEAESGGGMRNNNRYIKWIVALVLLLSAGTLGYVIYRAVGLPLDLLYMTVITVTTVGFEEVHPLSQGGRIFTIFLILGGVGTAFYILTNIVQVTLEGEYGLFRRQRMEARIRKLNNHFILCGYGRVGEAIANTLKSQPSDFVVIDHSLNSYTRAVQQDCLTIMDDATNHDVLKRAGVERAKSLITAFGDDAYNTYAVLRHVN